MPQSPHAGSIRVQVACSGLLLNVGIPDGALGIRQAPTDFVGSPSVTFPGRAPSLGNPATSYSAGHSRSKDCLVSSHASFLATTGCSGGLAPCL